MYNTKIISNGYYFLSKYCFRSLAVNTRDKLPYLFRKTTLIFNDEIQSAKIQLIYPGEAKMRPEVYSREEALAISRKLDTDLIFRAKNSKNDSAICDLKDVKEYLQLLSEEHKENNKNIIKDSKTLVIRTVISKHDLETKIKLAKNFILKKHPVKITVQAKLDVSKGQYADYKAYLEAYKSQEFKKRYNDAFDMAVNNKEFVDSSGLAQQTQTISKEVDSIDLSKIPLKDSHKLVLLDIQDKTAALDNIINEFDTELRTLCVKPSVSIVNSLSKSATFRPKDVLKSIKALPIEETQTRTKTKLDLMYHVGKKLKSMGEEVKSNPLFDRIEKIEKQNDEIVKLERAKLEQISVSDDSPDVIYNDGKSNNTEFNGDDEDDRGEDKEKDGENEEDEAENEEVDEEEGDGGDDEDNVESGDEIVNRKPQSQSRKKKSDMKRASIVRKYKREIKNRS